MIGIHVIGDKKLRRQIEKLTGKQLIKAAKNAAGKAMTPVARAIRSNINLSHPLPDADGFSPAPQNAASVARVQQALLKKTIGKRTKNLGRGSAILLSRA